MGGAARATATFPFATPRQGVAAGGSHAWLDSTRTDQQHPSAPTLLRAVTLGCPSISPLPDEGLARTWPPVDDANAGGVMHQSRPASDTLRQDLDLLFPAMSIPPVDSSPVAPRAAHARPRRRSIRLGILGV